MNFGIWWSVVAVVAVVAGACAESWQWPQEAASVRIDTKVRFLDQDNEHRGRVQADEAPFQEAAQTDGFYNRAGGAGRYPVRVETPLHSGTQAGTVYSQQLGSNYEYDGTLDSLQHCKCLSNPGCSPRHDSKRACGAGKFLCCYKGPNNVSPQNTEYFNEIEGERAPLLPGQEELTRPFSSAPGHSRDGVLVGPGGPTGNFGPGGHVDGGSGVLVGPNGPTGNIGPERQINKGPAVLVGPDGPTGVIGPHGHEDIIQPGNRNPGVLVGPEGPTYSIGPAPRNEHNDVRQSATAQRGILVGPRGPTGIIGPWGYGQPRGYGQQRPVLVGPSGPTGAIGPRMQGFFNEYFGRQRNPGILSGPSGPTGIIGPGRQLLVGPGMPTGRIGPQNYFV